MGASTDRTKKEKGMSHSATLGETPRVDAMLLSQERRSAIYFPLRLDETIALARTLERELSGIPEGRRSPPAGALESGSPLATSDATPGSAVPGPASIEEEFGLNRPLMMFLWSIPTGYQIHLDNHRFIPLHRYCRAAATHIKRLEAALSALSEKQQETVGCNWPVCGCKTRCPSTPSETGQITYEALLEANARQAQWITDLQGDIATLKEKFEDAWGRWVAAEKEIVRLQALPSAIEPSNDPRLTASPPHSAEFTVHEAPYAAAILATEKGLTPTGQHIADCERDAARYRFIRAEACKSYEEETESTTPESLYAWGFLLEGGQEPLDMDAAFDAAMKQEGK